MIEFSQNVECSFGRIMMDNVRNVEVIVGTWLWSTTLYLHRDSSRYVGLVHFTIRTSLLSSTVLR